MKRTFIHELFFRAISINLYLINVAIAEGKKGPHPFIGVVELNTTDSGKTIFYSFFRETQAPKDTIGNAKPCYGLVLRLVECFLSCIVNELYSILKSFVRSYLPRHQIPLQGQQSELREVDQALISGEFS